MSAKRRTTPLVRGTPIPSATACASAGLELPAISLMEPFLADMDASFRALLDTTFSISLSPRVRRVSMGEEISGQEVAGNPVAPFSRAKMVRKPPGWRLAGVVSAAAINPVPVAGPQQGADWQLFRFNVLEPDTASCAQAVPRLL